MRRAVVCLAVIAGVAAPMAPAMAAGGDDPYGSIWNILPPGSRGNIDATGLVTVATGGGTTAVDGSNAPANYANQLEMYDKLTTLQPAAISRTDLDSLYKRENFTPTTVTSTETPRAGTTIQRDEFGVPYITGVTYNDTMFGAGYAAIEDRMFLMDVLRHTGAARMAEFVGDSPSNVAADQAQLQIAFYTPAEAAAQVDKVIQRFGAEGQRLADGLDAYIAGINAAQESLCPSSPLPIGVGNSCPAEYAALQKTAKPWTRADVVYVASLVGGIFGKGGGQEAKNATYLQLLRQKFGKKIGNGVYRDLRQKLDKGSATTGSVPIAYGGGRRLDANKKGVALPDLNGPNVVATGSIASESGGAATRVAPSRYSAMAENLQKQFQNVRETFHSGMSNALLVSAKRSTTGHPVTVFGPQTGYYNPQLLVEQVLKGPGIYSRGVSFAGTNVVTQLGRGVDYAWSATSASNDLVDTVVERLCNGDGSPATITSTSYLVDGRCVPMQHNIHSETTTPNVSSTNASKTYNFNVWRTRHGIVESFRTVKGRPVAVVSQRSTYGHEIDSVVAFSRFNNPDYVHDAQSFQQAASTMDFTFNWFYTDSRDIAFYTSGLIPKRAKGTAFDFPRWGDSKYDWKGWLGYKQHAREINPASGYLVSWNNRQTKRWSAPDDIWAWGPVHRSLALSARIEAAFRRYGKVSIEQAVGVMADAATADTRAQYLLPVLLEAVGDDSVVSVLRKYLDPWMAAGMPRADRDRDGHYEYEQAIAIFDAWYQTGTDSLVYDVMGGKLGDLIKKVPQMLDDHPRQGSGSAWLDAPGYSWVYKELNARLHHKVKSPFKYKYCGNGKLWSCRKILQRSLIDSATALLGRQGVIDPKDLTYDKHIDDIRSVTAGVVGVRAIDWQNRPTFQQVVEFRSHR